MKDKMIIEMLLNELRKMRKNLDFTYRMSSEKVVQQYLNAEIESIDDLLDAVIEEGVK